MGVSGFGSRRVGFRLGLLRIFGCWMYGLRFGKLVVYCASSCSRGELCTAAYTSLNFSGLKHCFPRPRSEDLLIKGGVLACRNVGFLAGRVPVHSTLTCG